MGGGGTLVVRLGSEGWGWSGLNFSGVDGGVQNSSVMGCSSSNLVNVAITLIVGTTGIATFMIENNKILSNPGR